MSKYVNQKKNLWRTNKSSTLNRPVTEVLNQCQKKKKQTRMNLSEIKPPQSIRPSFFIDKEQDQNELFLNKNKNVNCKDENLKFQINCVDKCCQADDIMSVLSYGGYSVKSKFGNQNKIVHNHRKINKQTTYYFIEDEIPYLDIEKQKDNQIETKQSLGDKKNNAQQKKEWKKSQFAPLFYTKLDNFNTLERQTLHHEKRQKEILQNYEKDRQKQVERQRIRQVEKKQSHLNQKQLKPNPTEEIKNQAKKAQLSNSQKENIVAKTRQQQKILNGENFEMSKLPLPTTKHCYPCKIKFQNYKQHIQSPQHRLNVQKALGSSYFMQEMNSLQAMKKQQINSFESKMLQSFAVYLQKMVESNEQFITKNNQQLKINLKQINDEIQRWINA